MATQPRAGEMLVGAYLKLVEECEVVAYGQHSPLEGEQMEIDVIGMRPAGDQGVITCEVATHLRGLGYGNAEKNRERVEGKFKNAEVYIDRVFGTSESHQFQFWSPKVHNASEKELMKAAREFEDRTDTELELIINSEYTQRLTELRREAASTFSQRNELAFRILQILEHLE